MGKRRIVQAERRQKGQALFNRDPASERNKLHLGHAWDTTLQDMLIRQKRMQGFDTLWLPGMDHAGIATQAKVEARLAEQGISRYDLGREKFVDKVWEWKDEYASIIKQQWAKLGLSLDYDRERFTLDEGLSKAVRKVFVSLYKKGLIYRGEYIINWDPKARTALSDIEVIHQDDKGGAVQHGLHNQKDQQRHDDLGKRFNSFINTTKYDKCRNSKKYQHQNDRFDI